MYTTSLTRSTSPLPTQTRYSLGGEAGVASSGVASAAGAGVPSGGSPLVVSIGVASLGVSYVNGSSAGFPDDGDCDALIVLATLRLTPSIIAARLNLH